MLDPELISAFDDFRGATPGTPVCAAPSINLHFSQLGVVTACCFNRTQVLGVYPQQSVAEIWDGEPIRELREALSGYDLGRGCEKCQQQIEARDFGGSHAVFYSQSAAMMAETRREWGLPDDEALRPMRLEFNIHNACNLQCVMCHGLASSSIRSHREALPSLANPYDATFVDQLAPYLGAVVETDFMGGEPFMIPVYRMLWERIAVENPRMKVCILTNATLLDDSIKELLESFHCWMHVSIDSVFEATYEKIRRGASFETVMANCDYYNDLMHRRGLSFMFRYCPMRVNWREIPDTISFCNDRDIRIMFNQVDSPLSLSLHTLSPDELGTVVSYLERRAPDRAESETEAHNRTHYLELVHRLRGFLDPENRLNGLRSRLATSEAVIGQYQQGRKREVSRGVTVPVVDEDRDELVQLAKQYVTTRLNVDQARRTEESLPDDVLDTVAIRRDRLDGMRWTTDTETFAATYLGELVRVYASVWGVSAVHPADVFQRISAFAQALAGARDADRILDDLLAAPPRDLYEWIASSTPDEALARFHPEAA